MFAGFKVELEGFEPSSKQGTKGISTCLVCYWLSGLERKQTPSSSPYLLYFVTTPKLCRNYPKISCDSGSGRN